MSEKEKSFSASYAAAGVDITAGYKSVELMKKYISRTVTPGVLSGIGGFGGLYEPDFSAESSGLMASAPFLRWVSVLFLIYEDSIFFF